MNIVEKALQNGSFAHHLLESPPSGETLSARDRALLVELVHGTLRWHGQLDWILQQYFRGDYASCSRKLKSILEITLYQVRFLNKIPSYAAVSEGVALAKKIGGQAWGRLANGVLRNYLRSGDQLVFPSVKDDPVSALAVLHSHPEWLVDRWIDQFGLDETRRLCEWNNRRPHISIRVNLKNTTREQLRDKIGDSGIQVGASKYFDDFLKLSGSRDLRGVPGFASGDFAVQDESTALPILLLDPKPGERLIDLCAAPGGKTCHAAQLMRDDGQVIAIDRDRGRIRRLSANAKRMKLRSILPLVADGTTISLAPAERVLVDAPCSGLGVLSRRSDLRWKRNSNDLTHLQSLQLKLLHNAASLVRPGGFLAYSTCTIEPDETEEVIEAFLRAHAQFRIVGDEPNTLLAPFRTSEGFLKSLPHKHEMDGVFAAKLMRTT